MTLERKIQVGFGLALAIVLVVGAAALRSTTATVESAGWVAHTLQVRADLEAAFADVIDAETGVRGYVITGDSAYLAPYDSARATLGPRLSRLGTLIADNPVQQHRLDSLHTLIPIRFERLQRTIGVRRTRGTVAAGLAVMSGEGKVLTDRIRGLIARMEDEEGRLLARRSAALAARTREVRIAVAGGTLLTLGLAVVASVLVRREQARRRHAEEALRPTQARLQHVMASTTVVIYGNEVTGNSFSPNWVSENVTRLTGFDVAAAMDPAWWLEHLHPDDRARVLAEVPALFSQDRLTTEYRFRHADGSYRWVRDECRLLRDASGTPREVVGAWMDITEHQRAQQALRESEERFRALAASANDAIVSADSHGHITYFNPGAERLFGYAATDVTGQPLTLLMPERFRDAHRAGLARYLATGEAHVVGKTVELAGRAKDGREFPLELSLASWKQGSDVAFTGIIRDVTERVRVADELRRYAAQLEAANKELEAFSYSVSHDLRAPLRSIDGFSQALQEDYTARLDEEGRSHLRRVRAATQRMAHLIDDLLHLARVSRAELKSAPVDLSALAQGVVAELRQREPRRAVEFVCVDQTRVRGDPTLLRVVLENLLGNAWKFTAQRRPARIEFGVSQQDGATAYFVRDNGAGFDIAYADKLFGAFQRLHSAKEFEGTGIGLATVQRIIHRHGGRVWAESAVDQGATFYFTV